MVGSGERDCEGEAVLVRGLVVSVDALDVSVVAVSSVIDSVVGFVSLADVSLVCVVSISLSVVPVVGLPRKRK